MWSRISWCVHPYRVALVAIIAASLVSTAASQLTTYPLDGIRVRPPTARPAVVRVTAKERAAESQGSGTLVDVRGKYGLVLTNWHVVKDATGPLTVIFPSGFKSAAQVLRMDRDWDLAALAIWRPNVTPMAIAAKAPRPGEALTIAGYGEGQYREATGRCTQYVSPGRTLPYEMVEVAVSARQGDSGGPIVNHRGELAGVLFGSGGGATSGSYAGRVRRFLHGIWPVESLDAPSAPAIAAQPAAPQGVRPALPDSSPPPPQPTKGQFAAAANGASPPVGAQAPAAAAPAVSVTPSAADAPARDLASPTPIPRQDHGRLASTGSQAPSTPASHSQPGTPLFDKIRNVFAVIGVVSVLFHLLVGRRE